MKRLLKRLAGPAILCLALTLALAGCGKRGEEQITSFEQLTRRGTRMAIPLNSPQEPLVARDFPEAEVIPYVDIFPAYEEVANGRIDACMHARLEMEFAMANGVRGVRLLEENYSSNIIAVGISPVSPVPGLVEKINAFIAEKKADGTLEDMYNRWVILKEDTMPELPRPENPPFTLRVGTTGTIMPYSYYKGTELAGYDIELAHRFAAWLGAGLEFGIYDFGGIIPAAQTGDIDCIMANLYYMPEMAESIPFSDPLFEVEITAMVRDTTQALPGPNAAVYTSVDQLGGARIGVGTGSILDAIVTRRLPDAVFNYYDSYSDIVAALEAGTIAAFACDEPALNTVMAENDRVTRLPEYLDTFDLGFAFPKDGNGKALCEQMNAFIGELRASGKLDALKEKWANANVDDIPMPDIDALSGENGYLTMATNAMNPPFEFMRGREFAGLDIELAILFCESRGYGLKIQEMNFDAVLPSLQTGKADFAGASITITEERAQSVDFSDPYYSGGTVLAVLKPAEVQAANGAISGGIRDSFNKTFIREDRWQLFASGVVSTLVITLLSILCGTLLGFGVFMLCRNGNPVANMVTKVCLWLVQGMPMVVLLMILYYVIFGSVAIGGIAVAVIGFTLTFGSAVFGLLKLGVGAVDGGQYEAAYALGYSNRRTFFKNILPQALPHVMSAYRGEIVGLIKATAIVGYIAVQDLTKMGDIVRSRTYEAFFPLIAVTIIYFVLETLIGFIVRRVTLGVNPRRRSRGQILKGIRTEDQ